MQGSVQGRVMRIAAGQAHQLLSNLMVSRWSTAPKDHSLRLCRSALSKADLSYNIKLLRPCPPPILSTAN